MIGVSIGSAKVVGLTDVKSKADPSTCYLMVGEKCSSDCAFCTQARNSKSNAKFLSRVSWPEFGEEMIRKNLKVAINKRKIKNVCFQLTNSENAVEKAIEFRERFNGVDVPFCISCNGNKKTIEILIKNGFNKVCISLDACSEKIFKKIKSGSFEKNYSLLINSGKRFPGKIATHLIIGLGETEREAVELIHNLLEENITVGLFAFTPVKGTRLENKKQPEIGTYRRIQAALYLLKNKLIEFEKMEFNETGKLVDFGINKKRLEKYLSDGRAFETSGCENCNRPFYNERPGGIIYNYPRTLNKEEIAKAKYELGC